jgi:broad specificity phosphatase PhoE
VWSEDVRIEPRLREQDWANFQDPADIAAQKRLRNDYGHFYYRFTHGESGSDVYDRVSTFLESLWRYIEAVPSTRGRPPMSEQNLVIVTHGLTMRLFCMRWFHWSVEYFESLENPVNGGHVVLLRQPNLKYRLEEPFVQWHRDYVPTPRERASWL